MDETQEANGQIESSGMSEVLELECLAQNLEDQFVVRRKENMVVQQEINSLYAEITREKRRLNAKDNSSHEKELDAASEQIRQTEKRVVLLREELFRRRDAIEGQNSKQAGDVVLQQLIRERNSLCQDIDFQKSEFAELCKELRIKITELRAEYVRLKTKENVTHLCFGSVGSRY